MLGVAPACAFDRALGCGYHARLDLILRSHYISGFAGVPAEPPIRREGLLSAVVFDPEIALLRCFKDCLVNTADI